MYVVTSSCSLDIGKMYGGRNKHLVSVVGSYLRTKRPLNLQHRFIAVRAVGKANAVDVHNQVAPASSTYLSKVVRVVAVGFTDGVLKVWNVAPIPATKHPYLPCFFYV